MLFFTVLIVYLFVQGWGSSSPFHRDEWFYRWTELVARQEWLRERSGAVLTASLAGPVLLALLVLWGVREMHYWLQLFVAVPLVLYSLGRGSYTRHILTYLNAWRDDDLATAQQCVTRLGSAGPKAAPEPPAGTWAELHHQLLAVAAYQGFERVLAVMFWLVVLGPVGPFLYRLSALYWEGADGPDRDQAETWLWLMDWPAVRLIGLTYAVTGNFVGCFQRWSTSLAAVDRPSSELLVEYLEGALGLDDDRLDAQSLVEREFKAVLSLHRRTLIFWICLIAAASLFF